ncbi:glycosyl transferase, group 1 family protein [Mycolicibacterium aurum]|uniref:Glycosyl transferase, group 1 family protein n=1 Tax=Mycolicibacterium aurum TaxID=1791 RepID=A0A3S4SDX6_MYCAU|nr:glycosyltransferase [Mycolicibacterium aurum]VEG51006.1 glycosyl transferase, group 1 family protein [Mycolicibacterium aurum]
MTSVRYAGSPLDTEAPLSVALVGCVDDAHQADDLGALAAALGKRGHAVTAYIRHQGEQTLSAAGYQVHAIGLGRAAPVPAGDALAASGELAAALEDAWRHAVPDVVHAYGWLPGVAAQLAARRHRLPTVQSFHGVAAPAGPTADRARLETALARGAAWVTVASSADLEVLSRVRHNRSSVSLVPAGVDAERFAATAERAVDPHCRIGCLAPNDRLYEDVSRVLRVLPALGDSRLVVGTTGPAGRPDGADRKALQQLAAELGVAHRVTCLGHLRTDDVAKALRGVDVLVSTPTAAPDPGVVLAAMAGGVAVVAHDVDALADVVIHDVTGFLVPPHDVRELTVALKRLQSETFRREGMGAAGRTRARSRYSWDQIAVDVESAYRQAVRATI